MLVTLRKHYGRTVADVVLKDPSYIMWALGQPRPDDRLTAFRHEALRLIGIFDQKPFTCKCNRCSHWTATRCTIYKDNPRPMFWCSGCDPLSAGASARHLRNIRSYWDAFLYLHGAMMRYFSIGKLAKAKGMPDRMTGGG